jgi:hypothetical protein
MDVLIIEEGLVRPDTVVAGFVPQTPSAVKLCNSVSPDEVVVVWAAETPTLSFSGIITVTPDSAVMGISAGGEGPVVSASGGDLTINDYIRRGFPPTVVRIPESLCPAQSPAQVLVIGLRDTREPGQERREITVEDF